MKRLLMLFVCAVFAITAHAQSEHLTFKGVPINGTLSQYVAKMKAAGFSYVGEQDGTAMLKGDFAGFKNCIIGVNTLKGVNVVSAIGVIFPEREDWSMLESDYNSLKAMLTEKYGEPTEVVEEFENNYSSRSSSSKMLALATDECTWFTTFTTDKGKIQLSLIKFNYLSGAVLLKYFDKINTETVRSAAMDDL